MTQRELETVYEALAQAVDAVGPAQGEVFLAKVALALSELLDRPDATLAAIEECKNGLTG